MRLAAAKSKKAVLQPEFVTGIRANGTTTQIYPEECQLYLFRRGTDGLVLPAYDEAADVNSDGKVTVADHTPIINKVLGKGSL